MEVHSSDSGSDQVLPLHIPPAVEEEPQQFELFLKGTVSSTKKAATLKLAGNILKASVFIQNEALLKLKHVKTCQIFDKFFSML